MIKLLLKYKNIYIFLVTLATIGLLSGYIYYEIQPRSIKNEINEKLEIKESLNDRVSNISRSSKSIVKTIFFSITILPIIINIFNIFYKPFQTGFIFNVLSKYNIKFSILYNLFYLIIPFIMVLILTRISITITYNILKLIIKKNKHSKLIIYKSIKKYFLLSIILVIYEIFIMLISPQINSYLIEFL